MSSERQSLQFNVGVFNRVIIISMNDDFMCEFANALEFAKGELSFKNLMNSIDDLVENNKSYIADKEYTLVRHGDIYQLMLDNMFAKDLSAAIGDVLYSIRSGKQENNFAVDVIFAFVKKLEMAAFNHYRDLQEMQAMPRPQPIRQRNRFPNNQYPPFVRRYNAAQ
jgi:hypothetical protein